MTSRSRSFTSILILALACGTSRLVADVTFLNGYTGTATEVSSATELAYQADASNSDLLNGVTPSSFTTNPAFPTVGAWNTANGATVPELNDGIHGVSFAAAGNSVQGAWPNRLATVTYIIGPGANNLGHDITSIRSIVAWNGAGFGNQAWTLAVQPAGGGSFVDVATVNYQPLGATNPGATKVDLTGLNITGVQALKLTTISVNGGANGGAFVWRELDAVGTPTPVSSDTTPPTLNTLTSVTPADDATNVSVADNLTATFSEPIALTGAGTITLRNQSGGADISVTLPGDVSIAGAVLTINPASNLVSGTQYAVEISSGAIRDLATIPNAYAGLLATDTPNWNFTTPAADFTSPVVTSLDPVDDGSAVMLASNLVVTFNENVVLGTGDITIKNLGTPAQTTVITLPDARVTVAGAVLTINPSIDLAPATHYAVRIDATAIDAPAGNSFAGINDDTTWNFATQSVPAETSSTTQFVYSGNVSASDLLHGLIPVTTGWNTSNNASPLELTDGIHGAGFQVVAGDAVQGAWTTVGATAIYHLGLSPGGAGYDITSVQSIADWVSVGFGNQGWTIEVKPVGGSYSILATVDYQPLGAAGGGTTKVTLSDPSGVLASGIEFIRVTANPVNGGANAGAFVWRELDVFGLPTNDETAPQIVTFNPADNSPAVSPSSNLVATFDENIALGTGTITLVDLGPSPDIVITLPDSRVTVSGAQLIINPATDLSSGNPYAVRIAATAVTDISGNPFAGIDNDTTWNFTTGQPDLTAPAIASLSPADGATGVPLAANLIATFDEAIVLGSGTIAVRDLDTPANTVTITLPDGRVSVSGSVLTINLTSNLSPTTDYAVRVSPGAIADLSGNSFGGIADDTTWNFVTASTPLRIMCLGDSITVGYTDNPSWANHPFMFGYRSGLYTRLANADYNFQFVGASTEPWTGISGDPTNGGTYTPALDLRDFGQDKHRGYGGAGIWSNVNAWITADDPDVILLLIGINGIGTGSPAALNNLVNSIVTNAPGVHLIIAQITPRASFNQSLYDYNVYIRDTLVPTYAGNGHKVTTVDLYSLFLTDPNNYASAIQAGVLSNNINHPDNPRYDLMAQKWFEGIGALGLGPDAFDTWIADPAFGIDPAKRGLDDDADGDGIDNGVENYFGTRPDVFSQGLVAGSKSGNTFTFTHPIGDTPAADLTARYRWSKDMQTFTPDGDPFDGNTVSLSQGTPAGGFVTVTATVTGTPLEKLFVDVEVTRN